MLKTGIKIDGRELALKPVIWDKRIQLFDIYLDGEWCGSRRTISSCGAFLCLPNLAERILR